MKCIALFNLNHTDHFQEETKPGTKRYKLRNKPPPSLLEERRRRQQQKQEEKAKKQREEEQRQRNEEITPTETSESKPNTNNDRIFSLRRPSLSQKRRIQKKEQEELSKRQEELKLQDIQGKPEIEETSALPVTETQPSTSEDIAITSDGQSELKRTALTLKEYIEKEKENMEEARKKRIEQRQQMIASRRKQEQKVKSTIDQIIEEGQQTTESSVIVEVSYSSINNKLFINLLFCKLTIDSLHIASGC